MLHIRRVPHARRWRPRCSGPTGHRTARHGGPDDPDPPGAPGPAAPRGGCGGGGGIRRVGTGRRPGAWRGSCRPPRTGWLPRAPTRPRWPAARETTTAISPPSTAPPIRRTPCSTTTASQTNPAEAGRSVAVIEPLEIAYSTPPSPAIAEAEHEEEDLGARGGQPGGDGSRRRRPNRQNRPPRRRSFEIFHEKSDNTDQHEQQHHPHPRIGRVREPEPQRRQRPADRAVAERVHLEQHLVRQQRQRERGQGEHPPAEPERGQRHQQPDRARRQHPQQDRRQEAAARQENAHPQVSAAIEAKDGLGQVHHAADPGHHHERAEDQRQHEPLGGDAHVVIGPVKVNPSSAASADHPRQPAPPQRHPGQVVGRRRVLGGAARRPAPVTGSAAPARRTAG